MSFDHVRTRATALIALATMAIIFAACGSGAATVAPATQAAAATVSVATTGLGPTLVGPNGKTLYIFDKDTEANKSACAPGGCLSAWPPLLQATGTATAGAGVSGTLATFSRDDGTKQVSYNGKPLYYYAPDTKPGDTTGDGVGGVWHVAKP
jgi:predicted lipoprotein with Yx(FWY)xxD motif